jgi:hypothetical protein
VPVLFQTANQWASNSPTRPRQQDSQSRTSRVSILTESAAARPPSAAPSFVLPSASFSHDLISSSGPTGRFEKTFAAPANILAL